MAIITGCSVGIGRAMAQVLASEGAQTVLVAQRAALLTTLQEEIMAAGGACPHAMALDLADQQVPQRLSDEIITRGGRIDILVNNAGGSRPTATDAPDDLWDESLAINFTPVHKLTHACLPAMRSRQWGGILNMTSSAEPAGGQAQYGPRLPRLPGSTGRGPSL